MELYTMAKVTPSPLITDIRKKIGNVVFQTGRQKLIVRKRVAPAQPRTAAQRSVRADFSALSKEWATTLTQEKRNGWLALAAATVRHDRLGQAFFPTGLQLYQMCNRNLQTIAASTITDAPASLVVGSPSTATLTGAAGTPALSLACGSAAGTNELAVVYAAPPISPGRVSAGKRFRYLYKSAAAAAGPHDIKNAYVAKFGTLVAGQNVQVQVQYIDNQTGAASGKLQAQCFIAA